MEWDEEARGEDDDTMTIVPDDRSHPRRTKTPLTVKPRVIQWRSTVGPSKACIRIDVPDPDVSPKIPQVDREPNLRRPQDPDLPP